MTDQVLAFARLLTGRYDGMEALDIIEDRFPNLDDDKFLPVDSATDLLGSLSLLIRSNVAKQRSADQLARVRTLVASPQGIQVLKLAIPRCASDIVLALTTEDEIERDTTIVKVITRLVNAVVQLSKPILQVNGVLQHDLHVARLERPEFGQLVFVPVPGIDASPRQPGDFEIQGLFSHNDLELDNRALFRVLTRQTLSGVSMAFEDQFLRHLAWNVDKSNFETLYAKLTEAKRPVFKSVNGIPKNWPGWSENGGVFLTFSAYLEAVTKLQFQSLNKLLASGGISDAKSKAIRTFNELRGLWILRHLALVELETCNAHTYATLKPLLDVVAQDFETLVFEPSNTGEPAVVPASVIEILQRNISSHDTQGRFVTAFGGGEELQGIEGLAKIAQIPPGVLARILVSSGHTLYADPIFAQVVARDVSKSVRDSIAVSPDNTSSPAGSSTDAQNNLVSIAPTVEGFLRHGKPGSGLDRLESSIVRTTSLNAAKSFDLERSMAKSGLSPDSVWAYDPQTVMVSAIEPFAGFTGSLAAVGNQESQDPNQGYAVSVLADRLSSQTYFTDAATFEPSLQSILNFPTALGDWRVVFPHGLFAATTELIKIVDILARVAPLDGIESHASTLQQLAGRRVELASGSTPSTVSAPSFDAETYPVMDFVHSGFTGYMAPFGRSWAALKHAMMRQGVGIVTNSGTAELVENVTNTNAWTWLLANGTAEALQEVYATAARIRGTVSNTDFSVRTSFESIDGLAEPLNDSIHPASLLSAFVSGDADLDLGDVEHVYTEKTAPLMAFIVQMRLTDTAIEDLGVPLFTDNLMFDFLKSLVTAMVQRLDDEVIVEKAIGTPMGAFVVAAAKLVGEHTPPTNQDDVMAQIEAIINNQYELLDQQALERAKADDTISLDDRKAKHQMLDLDLLGSSAGFRTQRMQAVASSYAGVEGALETIHRLSQEDREILVPQACVIPVYAILPTFGIGPVRAVAETDNCNFDANGMSIRDGVLFGINAQLDPSRFADEVFNAVMHGRELYGGPDLPVDQLDDLTNQLRAVVDATFGLGALVSDPDNTSVQDVVEVAGLLIGQPSDEERATIGKSVKASDPLYRIYPNEPFDFSPYLIREMASKLLDDLRKALAFRKKIRTPLESGTTMMEVFATMDDDESQVAFDAYLSSDFVSIGEVSFERIKRLEDNSLSIYERTRAPWSPEVREWVSGIPQKGNQETWKDLVITGRALDQVGIRSKISALRTGIQRKEMQTFAENAGFVLDRVLAEGTGMASTAGLRAISNVGLGLTGFDDVTVGLTTRAIAESLSSVSRDAFRAADLTDGNSLLISLIDNAELQQEAREILRLTGYFSMRDLSKDPAVTAETPFASDNLLEIADTIALIEALYDISNANAFSAHISETRDVNTFAKAIGGQSEMEQLIRSVQGPDIRAGIIEQIRARGIDTKILNYAINTATPVAVREVILGRVNFSHVANFDPFPRSSNVQSMSLDDALNMEVSKINPSSKETPSTNTGRYAMWSAQVRQVLYFANALGPRLDAKYLMWPFLRDFANKSKGKPANSKLDGIGLSATRVGETWISNTMKVVGNHIGATFAAMLYEELDAVRKQLDREDWAPSFSTAELVDGIVGSKETFTSFAIVARSTTEYNIVNKGQSLDTNSATHSAHIARSYTAAPELIIRNSFNLRPHINPAVVARALSQIRRQGVYNSNYLLRAKVSSRWSGLSPERRRWESAPGKFRPRYALWQRGRPPAIPTPEMTYRLVQSPFNAAHIMSIIDELGLIDSTRSFVDIDVDPEKESELVKVYQPAVLVAGMLRPTEPLLIRLGANEFGLQVPDIFETIITQTRPADFEGELLDLRNFSYALPTLAHRILEMVESIANTKNVEDPPSRVKKRSAPAETQKKKKASARTTPNQDVINAKTFAFERFQEVMRWMFARRGDMQIQEVDFSGYVPSKFTVLTQFVVLDRDELAEFWAILNNNNGGADSAFDIKLCSTSANGVCRKTRRAPPNLHMVSATYAEDTRTFVTNMPDEIGGDDWYPDTLVPMDFDPEPDLQELDPLPPQLILLGPVEDSPSPEQGGPTSMFDTPIPSSQENTLKRKRSQSPEDSASQSPSDPKRPRLLEPFLGGLSPLEFESDWVEDEAWDVENSRHGLFPRYGSPDLMDPAEHLEMLTEAFNRIAQM